MVPGNSLASCGNTILRSVPFTQTDSQQAPDRSVRLGGTQFINPAAWAGDAAGNRSATAARVNAAMRAPLVIRERVVPAETTFVTVASVISSFPSCRSTRRAV